ncbi:hypothetical protein T439DRAFT_327425 [Meredithblackwellia eburnea MCA 4105]
MVRRLATGAFLAGLVASITAQTAGTTAPLIYTYEGQSAPSSVLAAIATAGEPASAILASSGQDTATGLVGAFPTTTTVGPTTAPALTSSFTFVSATGEVYSTATRAPYIASGTVNTNLAGTTPSPTTSVKSSANRLGTGLRFERGSVLGVMLALGGVAVGAGMFL